MPKGDSHPHPFCAQLASRARQNKTRIVLPEMADARVAKAAKRAAQSGIA
ncbi:MAG: phosphate acyltransferase, partial [Gammaproteobacteria bacterium]